VQFLWVGIVLLTVALAIGVTRVVADRGAHVALTGAGFDPWTVHPLEASFRTAVQAGVTRENLREHIPVPPDVDTATFEGLVDHRMLRLRLDENTATLLGKSPSMLYWILNPAGTPRVVGIVWDQDGKPHCFTASIGE
jgi:hypothetical protein